MSSSCQCHTDPHLPTLAVCGPHAKTAEQRRKPVLVNTGVLKYEYMNLKIQNKLTNKFKTCHETEQPKFINGFKIFC